MESVQTFNDGDKFIRTVDATYIQITGISHTYETTKKDYVGTVLRTDPSFDGVIYCTKGGVHLTKNIELVERAKKN